MRPWFSSTSIRPSTRTPPATCYSQNTMTRLVELRRPFGPANFRNEIIWTRTSSHNDARKFADVYEYILYSSRAKAATWNAQHQTGSRLWIQGFTPPWGWRVVLAKLQALDEAGRLMRSKGRRGTSTPYLVRFLDEQGGAAMPSLWQDHRRAASANKRDIKAGAEGAAESQGDKPYAIRRTGRFTLTHYCGGRGCGGRRRRQEAGEAVARGGRDNAEGQKPRARDWGGDWGCLAPIPNPQPPTPRIT
jgi:hypothetical protein